MNKEKFYKIFPAENISTSKQLLLIAETEDTLSSILRIHLLCEQIVEAWIAAACNQENLFYDGADRIRVDFEAKLKIAKNLNFPKQLYETIKKINRLRNNFAHEIKSEHIPQSFFDSVKDQLNSMEGSIPLQDQGIETHTATGKIRHKLYFNDPATKDSLKLLIVFGCILMNTINIVNEEEQP